MYEYAAEVLRVVDGDTIHARLDLGVDVRIDLTLRLAHINAPENSTPEGQQATAYIETLLYTGLPVIVQTLKDRREKYGRYLAVVFLDGDPVSVNQKMLDSGHAVPDEGR